MKYDRGNDLLAVIDLFDVLEGVRVFVDIDPFVGDPLLPKELLGPPAVRTPGRALHLDLGFVHILILTRCVYWPAGYIARLVQ